MVVKSHKSQRARLPSAESVWMVMAMSFSSANVSAVSITAGVVPQSCRLGIHATPIRQKPMPISLPDNQTEWPDSDPIQECFTPWPDYRRLPLCNQLHPLYWLCPRVTLSQLRQPEQNTPWKMQRLVKGKGAETTLRIRLWWLPWVLPMPNLPKFLQHRIVQESMISVL